VAPETRARTVTDNAQATARRSSSQVPQPPPGTGSRSASQTEGTRDSIRQSSSFWTTRTANGPRRTHRRNRGSHNRLKNTELTN
jgi:hypothetical protein